MFISNCLFMSKTSFYFYTSHLFYSFLLQKVENSSKGFYCCCLLSEHRQCIPIGHNFPRQAFSTIKALHKLSSLHNQKKNIVEKMVIKKQVRDDLHSFSQSRLYSLEQLNKKISGVKVNKPHQQQLRQIHHDSDSNQQ
jgi:hypothetical protein